MKITDNKRAIILTQTDSPYFEQSIFILKENIVREEDKLLNEARNVAERYAKKCEKSKMLVKADRKTALKYVTATLLGGIFGAVSMLIFSVL